MANYKRRTKEEMIKDLEEKLNKLKNAAPKKEKPELSMSSEGLSAVADAVDFAAKANKVKVADILILIAKAKRTGLVIEGGRRSRNSAQS